MPSLDMLPTVDQLNSPNSGVVTSPRIGVLLHFDDSSNDKWAVAWFRDPACKVSYNRLYLDSGDVVSICPMSRKAWHAGVCRQKDANSAFYGLSAATNAQTPVTQKQFESICYDTASLFRYHGWTASEVETRIVGHDAQAIYGPANTKRRELWGKGGRKIDPTGYDPARPILSVPKVRTIVALLLSEGHHR